VISKVIVIISICFALFAYTSSSPSPPSHPVSSRLVQIPGVLVHYSWQRHMCQMGPLMLCSSKKGVAGGHMWVAHMLPGVVHKAATKHVCCLKGYAAAGSGYAAPGYTAAAAGPQPAASV
jgi:hypothetical protein